MMVSIRIKLGVLAGVLVSVVLAVAGGFYSFFALQRGDALVVSLAGTARVLSEQIERDAIAVLAGIEDESARASLRKSAETFDATLDRMVKGDDSLHVLAATDQVLVEQLKAVGGAWQRTKQGALLIAGSQTGTDAMRRAYADFADANAVLERQIDAAVTLFQQQASGKVATLQRMTAAAVALAFIVAFLGWLATGTLVVGPVRRLVASAMRLADGDLDQAPEFTNLDEVGEAGRSLRHVIDVLNSVIASIQQLSRGMETTSTLVRGGSRAVVHNVDRQTQLVDGMLDVFRREMDATFARVEADIGSLSEAANSGASASHELERAMQELADGGEVLSASVGQTASAQTELGASMREVSESVEVLLRQMDVADGALNGIAGAVAEVRGTAEETSRLAETVIVDARNGLSAVQSTQLGNEGIRRVTGEGKASIESLHDRLQAMEQIMDVINSVAYETNILALNAAIIASQAGEQGRSFAVVAERVRGLAERSARSTHDVSALITGIRGDSQRAVDAMTRAEQEVDKGVELSVHAVDALGKIVDSAQRSTQRVQDIATTASEQTRGSMAALEAMASARTMCSRIAAAMQEQTRGSSVIANAASRIDAIARQVRDATRGQVTAMTHIRKLGEEVGGIVGSVEKAIEVHRRAREGFLETAGQLVEIARDTGAQARKTDQVIIDMAQHASLLGDQVSRFRLRRLEPRQKARNQST